MYHDKRFQTDRNFVFVAFSHEQIKTCTSCGFLLTQSSKFEDIAEQLLTVNTLTLESLTKRMEAGEIVKPETDNEKICFQLINNIDCVASHVPGLISNKKIQQNELWSLTAYKGAPLWYITLSPADSKHLIALYFASTDETFHPLLRTENE